MNAAGPWIEIARCPVDKLPPFGEPVLSHSRNPEWSPGIVWREKMPGGGWAWTDAFEGEGLEEIEFFALILPLPTPSLSAPGAPAKKAPAKKVAKKSKGPK